MGDEGAARSQQRRAQLCVPKARSEIPEADGATMGAKGAGEIPAAEFATIGAKGAGEIPAVERNYLHRMRRHQ